MTRIKTEFRAQAMEQTRQSLLNVAAEEFARNGYEQANINTISTRAGYAKGTIYNYFPSKQALVLALIAEAGADHVTFITHQVREAHDPQQRLARFYEAGFRFIEEHPVQARFLITTLYTPEAALQEAMFQAYQPLFGLVAGDILAPGIAQGLFRAVDLAETATLLMTLYLGTASNVDNQGKVFMDFHQVADFALHALQNVNGSEKSGE